MSIGPRLLADRVSLRKAESGASLVEYAFILIIFLTLIFGIGGFGHGLFVYHYLSEAAKEATRYAAVRGSTCGSDSSCVASNSATGITGPTTMADVTSYVQSITPQSIDSSKITVIVCGVSDTATKVSDSGGVCTDSPPICSGPVGTAPAEPLGYPGCTVRVQVAYAYDFVFPLLPSVTTKSAPCTVAGICLSSASEMVIAH